MSEINSEAEKLFEIEVRDCLWKPCFEIVAAVTPSGAAFCRMDCPIRQSLEEGVDLGIHHLLLPHRAGGSRAIHLMAIAVTGPDGQRPWLVHCVMEAARCQRLHNYVTRVANRAIVTPEFMPDNRPLTPRETEILDLMADDLDLDQIAQKLHVSYHTIRNHVQHILPKLSAHSIQQAIAIYLLEERAPHNRVTQ